MVQAVRCALARALPERIPLSELLGLFATAGDAEAAMWREFFGDAIEDGRLVAEHETRVIPARRVRVGRRIRSYGPCSDRQPDPSHRDIPEHTEAFAVYSRTAVLDYLRAKGIDPRAFPVAWAWLELAASAPPDHALRRAIREFPDRSLKLAASAPPDHAAPRTRTDRLGEAIEAALADLRQCLGREPTDPELYERLRPGRDTTGAVVDENDSGLIWTDSHGASHTTNRAALTRRFKRMRSRDR